ncbi:MAG: glycine cleavage system protein H [FCB group bacterium]|nr:glycine cleavage system protein H [FCB group bacterium]
MDIQGYHMPDNLFYEEHHYWIMVQDDTLKMGMDDFAQKLAGEIVFVQLPSEGKKLKKGKKFAKVESGKWVGKIFAPVNGEILASNQALEMDPTIIHKDCYGEGWMYEIKPDDMREVEQLIHSRDAIEKWVLDDIEKYNRD